jgi:hypothetical protein
VPEGRDAISEVYRINGWGKVQNNSTYLFFMCLSSLADPSISVKRKVTVPVRNLCPLLLSDKSPMDRVYRILKVRFKGKIELALRPKRNIVN